MLEEKHTRVGLFKYNQLKKDEYEVGLEIPIKFTKRQQKELQEYIWGVFGEDAQFEVVGEDMTATKTFIIKKIS